MRGIAVDTYTVLTVHTAPKPIPGDTNRDGTVDVSDLGILATNYGQGDGFEWDDGDFNGDGFVDVSDLGSRYIGLPLFLITLVWLWIRMMEEPGKLKSVQAET